MSKHVYIYGYVHASEVCVWLCICVHMCMYVCMTSMREHVCMNRNISICFSVCENLHGWNLFMMPVCAGG